MAQLHKTVALNYKDEKGRHLVVVIIPATARVSVEKVAAALGIPANKLKSAQPDFIRQQTGFVPGGIPPIGFEAKRLVDSSVFLHPWIIAGGGNNLNEYTKMDTAQLRELNPDLVEGSFQITQENI